MATKMHDSSVNVEDNDENGKSPIIPDDFFDDFMKDDFMAGLDIVDEDTDKKDSEPPKSKRPSKIARPSKIDHVKKFRQSPPGVVPNKKKKKSVQYDKELKKLNKELDKIKQEPKKKPKTKPDDSDQFDIRRDPEKTRQAIQLDKLKSAKDKEKRIITDIVQTGLVPPGMELEVNMDEIQNSEKFDLRNKIRKKTRSKSPEKRRVRASPLYRSRRSPRRSPIPRRSPVYRPRLSNKNSEHSRSPKMSHKSRSPRRSPRRRSRSRSFNRPLYRRSRSRDLSPAYRRRSPRRRRSRSRSAQRTKKESFIEEIVAKLNAPAVYSTNYAPVVESYAPVVDYAPVLEPYYPPIQSQPAAPPRAPPTSDPYDESFFIGAPMATARATQFQDDDDKLFADSRIKLSEFLAITVKPQVNKESTASLQGKIQVIQRCQDAARIIKEKKFTGPLTVYKVNSFAASTDKTMSPLLRKPLIQLPFTTPGAKDISEPSYETKCKMLVRRVGVTPRDVATTRKTLSVKTHKPVKPAPKEPPKTTAPQVIIKAPPKPITASYGVQTDKELSACRACLHRNQKLYANSAVQAGDIQMTFSVSTQVTEADFYSMIPRNQSLASLTPAQLLGKQSMLRAHETRHVPSPPPPPALMGFPFPSSFSNNMPVARTNPYPDMDMRKGGFQRF